MPRPAKTLSQAFHAVHNSLAAVSLSAELLADELAPSLVPRQRRQLSLLIKEIKTLQKELQQLEDRLVSQNA